MIQMTCNGCDKVINRNKDRWFGADVMEVDEDEEPADDQVDGEYRFHFCSEACASAAFYAMALGEVADKSSTKGASDG